MISIRTRNVSGTGHFRHAPDADFEIVEKLAEGGMGVVYIAVQKSLNRELAIKTLKSTTNPMSGTVGRSNGKKTMSRADRQKREMFLSEALVTANLVHPNIIPIHELAETGEGIPYYVMKRVHGIPWNKRVREMSLAENLDVLHKVCDAIAYAHHHGVINRDLKPENIMLGEFGEVLVLDWGLAVPAPHAAEQNFKSPVASFGAGTPAYMAPELWLGPPEAIGESSDIYLLGAILFEIVTGDPPHEFPKQGKDGAKSDIWKLIDTVLRENIVRSTSQSGELLDIAYKAMRTNPDERFGSVLELQFAVRNYQRHEESRRLSSRASELIDSQPNSERDYHTCQTAAALFEESLRTWPQNVPARSGLRATRLTYAKLASDKGDFDLGLQVASQETDTEFTTLANKLRSAKRIRSSIKWTALAAMLCVVALGAKSIYDNGIITNLNSEVADRKQEANEAIRQADTAKDSALVAKREADESKESAEKAKQEATTAIASADAAKKEATLAQTEAVAARMEATESSKEALIAKSEAATALAAAETSKKEAEAAVATAEEATVKVQKANEQLVIAEQSAAAAVVQQEKAETAARVAQVEIQSQSIRGLTLNENYADALREINRLLDGELLPQLPPLVRDQRTAELQAQREQLLKRARRSEEPIQTQSVSPDGKRLVMADAVGHIVVMDNPADLMTWPTTLTNELQLGQQVSAIAFSDSTTVLLASGSDLLIWKTSDPAPQKLAGHQAAVRAVDVQGNLAVSGDASGHLIAWDLTTGTRICDLRAKTSIRDVAIIPGTRDFVYAGARGEQSADILAYRIPETADADRPVRLGQLRMSRQHNHPPVQLSISPDGRLLVISNSNNGQLFVLPASRKTADSPASGFPFLQPADLEASGDMSWLVSQHSRPVNDVQWSSDGLRVLTASDDRRIGVWSLTSEAGSNASLTFQRFLRGHGARVMQARFLDAAATRISSCSADGFSRLWDLKTLENDSREIREAFDLSRTSLQNSHRQTYASVSSGHRLHDGQRLAKGHSSGKYLVTALPVSEESFAKRIEVEDSQSATESVVLNAESTQHRGSLRSVQFNSDGSRLVSGAADGSIVVWDANSHLPITGPDATSHIMTMEQFQEGHEFNISRMKIVGPERNILATAGFDGSLRLWNLNPATGREGVQQQVIAGLGLVNTFAASPDGQFLVTSSVEEQASHEPGRCSIWRLTDLLSAAIPLPAAHLSGAHRAEVTAISISKDNRRIATGGRDGMIAVWEARTFQRLAAYRAHTKNTIVTALEWLPDDTFLSSGLDGKLALWSLTAASADDSPDKATTPELPLRIIQKTKFVRDRTPIEQISVSPDQSRILAISVQTDRVTKTTTYHLVSHLLASPSESTPIRIAAVAGKAPQTIASTQWSADGLRVLVCADNSVQVFDATTWKVTRVFAAGYSGVSDAQFLEASNGQNDQQQILTFDGSVASKWDLNSGAHLVGFRGPYPINAVTFADTPAHPLVIAAGESLRVFDGGSSSSSFGRPLFHLQKQHTGQITAVAVCPTDPLQWVTSGMDGNVILWQWQAADQRAVKIATLASLKSPVSTTQWSFDGRQILCVTMDGAVAFIGRKENQIATLQLSSDRPVNLSTAAFSSDGRHAVVAGQIARTFESVGWVLRSPLEEVLPETDQIHGRLPAERFIECTFSGHEAGGISSACFVKESPYLVSGGRDGALILWNWKNSLPAAIPAAYEAYRFLAENQSTAHQGPITAVAVASSGTIATTSEDGRLILWSLSLLVR